MPRVVIDDSILRCGVCGVWCVVCGVWCVVCGVWCVVCGVRCVVCGVWWLSVCVGMWECVWVCGLCGVWCVAKPNSCNNAAL